MFLPDPVINQLRMSLPLSTCTRLCLIICLLFLAPVPIRADLVISDAALGTNGSTTYPANPWPITQGEALTIEAGGSITTTGAGNCGVYGSSNNDINVSGTISTSGSGAMGIQVSNNSTINLAGTINISGEGIGDVFDRPSSGIPVYGDDLVVIGPSQPFLFGIKANNNNQIDISGLVDITGDGAQGVYLNEGNTLSLSGEIKAIGSASDAVIIQSDNSIDITGNISTQAKGASGIYAYDDNHINLTGSITTQGKYADAIIAVSGNNINVSGTITTAGENAHGLYTGYGTNINMSGTITTSGETSPGIYNYGGNTIDISGTVNTKNSTGMSIGVYYADMLNVSGTVNGYIHTAYLDTVNISGSVLSLGNTGIHDEGSSNLNISGIVSSAGDNGTCIEASGHLDMSGTISTTGYQNPGLNPGEGADVSGTIQTSGTQSYGIIVYGTNLLMSGTVSTSGTEAHGIFTSSDNFLNISGIVSAAGDGADGINLEYGGNSVHLSGWISASGSGSYALHSQSMYNLIGPGGDSDQPSGENVFHLLNGVDIAGDIHNSGAGWAAHLTSGRTAHLTFGYAKNRDGTANMTAVDPNFTLTLGGSITSSSDGSWDGYFAGGSTTLSGTSNEFRNLFIGGLTFDGVSVPEGFGDTTSLAAIADAAANLNVTRAMSTDGTIYIGQGSTYSLAGVHTHTGSEVFLNGTLSLNSGSSFLNHAANTDNHSNYFVNNSVLTVTGGQTGRIEGNYSQTENGSLVLEACGIADYGKLVVTGTADFSDSNTLTVELSSDNTLKANDVLQDVVSAGILIADSDEITVNYNSAMWRFVPYINNNAIDLIYKSHLTCTEAVSGSSSVFSPLASGAAGVLDHLFQTGTTNGDMQTVLNELSALGTNNQVGRAVAQIVPVLAGAGNQIGFDLAVNGAVQVVGSRMAGFRGMSAGDAVFEDRMAWIKPYYSRTEQDKRNGIDGYTADTYGLVIGVDGRVHPNLQIGAALSYGTSDINSDSSIATHTQDVKTWQATLYTNNEITDTLTLNLIGALGFNTNESDRNILFGNINRIASAKYDSLHALLDGELIKTWALDEKLSLSTSLKIQYIYLDVEGYEETGADSLNLSVEGTDADSLVASIGGGLKYAVASNQNLTARIDIGYDFLADTSSLISSYAGGGPSFAIRGNSPDEIVYRGGIGYELNHSTGLEIALHYRMEARKDFKNHTGSINFRFPF